MLKTLKTLSIATAVLTLTNCSQPTFIALPEELKDNITSSEAYYEKAQDKMYAQVESSNITALNGGLLFILAESIADSVKENNAEKSLEPLQKFFKQADTDLKLRSAIQNALKSTAWLHVSKVSQAGSIESKDIELIVTNSGTDAVVVLEPDLRLNPRFDVLTGTLFLTVYPSGAALKAKLGVNTAKEALNKPIYKTKVMATFELPHFTEDVDQNAAKWAEFNGKYFIEGLDKVIKSLGAQLEAALKNPHTTME
jgi:hypothetical protein